MSGTTTVVFFPDLIVSGRSNTHPAECFCTWAKHVSNHDPQYYSKHFEIRKVDDDVVDDVDVVVDDGDDDDDDDDVDVDVGDVDCPHFTFTQGLAGLLFRRNAENSVL